MSTLLLILTLIAAVGVVISLLLGFFVMVKGGNTDKKYSNKLMQARIILQGLAILFFILALLTAHR